MPEKKLVRKTYVAKAEVDDDERTVTAVISTSAVDREKEVLLPKGADFEQYEKNPVVLWAHDYREPPIGRALWIKNTRKNITAKVKFAETEKADEVYQLFRGKFLNAFSVGFLPAEDGSHPPTPDEVKKNPDWAEARRIYDKWELLEFSAVPVPANPEALATAVKSKELAISKETQDELGIEDEEITYYADTITAEAIETANKVFEKQKFNCECIKCGHKLTTEKHCNKIKCPKCGGEMRRQERPGPGRGIKSTMTNAEGILIYEYDDGQRCEVVQWGVDKNNWTLWGKLGPILKPEETDDYIRIPVRDCKVTATITISAKEGIKGLYCGKIKKVRTYLFAKAKKWTMAKAKKWVKEHDDGKGCECEVLTHIPVKVTDKVPVKTEQDNELIISRYIKRKKGIMYE